jgi:hypothetical protein
LAIREGLRVARINPPPIHNWYFFRRHLPVSGCPYTDQKFRPHREVFTKSVLNVVENVVEKK